MKSQTFPRIIHTAERHVFPRSFCELFFIKAGLSMVKSAENFDILRIILRKVSVPQKVEISLIKGLSLLLKLIYFRQKFNHGWSVLPQIWKKKFKKYGITKDKFFTFHGQYAERHTSCSNISENSRENIKLLVDAHQDRYEKISCYSLFNDILGMDSHIIYHSPSGIGMNAMLLSLNI